MTDSKKVRIEHTAEQKPALKNQPAKAAEASELSAEAREQRIAPRRPQFGM